MTDTAVVPEVGMPATYHCGSDRYAMTVVKTERNGRTVRAVFASAVPDGGVTNDWVIRVEADHMARTTSLGLPASDPWHTFTLRGDGRFRAKGSARGFTLTLGEAEDYRDPSF